MRPFKIWFDDSQHLFYMLQFVIILFLYQSSKQIREQDLKIQPIDICALPLRTGSMVESLGKGNASFALLVR